MSRADRIVCPPLRPTPGIVVLDVAAAAAFYFNLSLTDLRGPSTSRAFSRPRMVAMYLSRRLTTQSLIGVGNIFGRDHTTVKHAERDVKQWRRTQRQTATALFIITRLTFSFARRRKLRERTLVAELIQQQPPAQPEEGAA